MKEEHIKCGDWETMRQALIKAKIEQTKDTGLQYLGMKIIVDKTIPKNEAHLYSASGQLVKIFAI